MATDIPSVQFRPGRDLLVELEARGPSIHQVAKRMCERYLEMMAEELYGVSESRAREYWDQWNARDVQQWESWLYMELFDIESGVNAMLAEAITDALERAHVLVERDGFTVAEALVAVGLCTNMRTESTATDAEPH